MPKKPKASSQRPEPEQRSAGHCGRRSADRDGVRRLVELARAAEELEEFATIAAHDLHEPLRTIAGFAQLLEERHAAGLGEQGRECVSQIVDGASRMQRLLDVLLDYSRLARGPLTLVETNLEDALRLAERSVATALGECRGALTSGPLPRVVADEPRIVQLFSQLLDNAVKFRGEQPPRVHVDARAGERELLVSVADNGIGIEPRQFERVFRVFTRLHPVDRYPGTGAGLAVCKRIVERHGGRIWVESEPGRGSTFRFTLPLPK